MQMKNKILLSAVLLAVTMCFCGFKNKKDKQSAPIPDKSKSEIVVVAGDTINIGEFPRSKYTSVVHLVWVNHEGTDLHVHEISVKDPRIEISASPTITAGAKGTIALILDTEKMREGVQYKKVDIKTDCKTNPNTVFYIKYSILPYRDPEPVPSVVIKLKEKK